MSREKDLEDMQEFVDEYANIKEELNELISSLEEDYGERNQNFIERINELENEEEDSLVKEYYSMRL